MSIFAQVDGPVIHVDEYKSSKKLKLEGGETLYRTIEQLEIHLQERTYLYVKDITAYV